MGRFGLGIPWVGPVNLEALNLPQQSIKTQFRFHISLLTAGGAGAPACSVDFRNEGKKVLILGPKKLEGPPL